MTSLSSLYLITTCMPSFTTHFSINNNKSTTPKQKQSLISVLCIFKSKFNKGLPPPEKNWLTKQEQKKIFTSIRKRKKTCGEGGGENKFRKLNQKRMKQKAKEYFVHLWPLTTQVTISVNKLQWIKNFIPLIFHAILLATV